MPLIADLRELPRPAWILFAGTFINRFGSFVHPFLVLYLTSRGYSVAIAGLEMGAYGAGHFIASFVGGWLADGIGRRRSIAISMFGSAGAMLSLSSAETLEPRESRPRLVNALEMLANKRDANPAKKHGCIPL